MKTLRDYQVRAKDELLEVLLFDSRACLIMPPRLGKTLTVIHPIQELLDGHVDEDYKILWLAHTVSLVQQAQEVFEEEDNEGQYSIAQMSSDFDQTTQYNVLFSTLQMMGMHRDRFAQYEFAIVVVDEAHYGMAPDFRSTIEYFNFCFFIF